MRHNTTVDADETLSVNLKIELKSALGVHKAYPKCSRDLRGTVLMEVSLGFVGVPVDG
jgi:hypothetical protein